MNRPNERDALPIHPVPAEMKERQAAWRIRFGGLVRNSGEFGLETFAALPRVRLTDDFVCDEGWQVSDLRWSGVPLQAILKWAGILPAAQYVRVGSGDFFVTLPVADLTDRVPLLADHLDDRPLAVENGAPWRLVAPGNACYTSIKWVDRIEALATAEVPDSAPTIAKARLQAQETTTS